MPRIELKGIEEMLATLCPNQEPEAGTAKKAKLEVRKKRKTAEEAKLKGKNPASTSQDLPEQLSGGLAPIAVVTTLEDINIPPIRTTQKKDLPSSSNPAEGSALGKRTFEGEAKRNQGPSPSSNIETRHRTSTEPTRQPAESDIWAPNLSGAPGFCITKKDTVKNPRVAVGVINAVMLPNDLGALRKRSSSSIVEAGMSSICQAAQAMKSLQEVLHRHSRESKALKAQNDQLFVKNNELGNALTKAEADIRRLDAEEIARQGELSLCEQDRDRFLSERDSLREEKESLLTEVESLRAKVKLSEGKVSKLLAGLNNAENGLQDALVAQHEERDRADAALVKLEVALAKLQEKEANTEEELCKSYNEGLTTAYAKIKKDLPGMQSKLKKEGWFLALQRLNLTPEQVGMEKGPQITDKLPPSFGWLVSSEDEKENEEADSDFEIDSDIEIIEDQDIIPPIVASQTLEETSVLNQTVAANPAEVLILNTEPASVLGNTLPSVTSTETIPASSTVPDIELESTLPENQDKVVE